MKKKLVIIIVSVVILIILLSWILLAGSYKNVDYYIEKIDDNIIVKDYKLFYTVDEITNKILINFFEYNDVNTIWNVMINSFKLNTKKSDFENKFNDFRTLILYENKSEFEEGLYIGKTQNLLYKLYQFSKSTYLCELNSEYNSNKYYILINLDRQNKIFKICDFTTKKVGETNETK